MRRPPLRVSYTTRRVRYPVHGQGRTDGSDDTKRGAKGKSAKGVKKLSDKGKDRVPCKTKQ